ncbi:MAG: sensor histidine kinase [Gilvibacter sp.]
MRFRQEALAKAYALNQKLGEDSLKARSLSTIAYRYLKLNDYASFKRINQEAYTLARKVKDSFTMGDTYWNYANFFKSQHVYDSAYYYYYNANVFFEAAEKPFLSAKMLYGMSFIKGRFRDYYGSEQLIVQAIDKYKSLGKNKSLYASYDHLSTLNLDIKNYDKALEYHKEAQRYRSQIEGKGDTFKEGALNNLGLIYSAKGDYQRAISEFSEALKSKDLEQRNALLFARLLDNKSYAHLLSGDTLGVNKGLNEALSIRHSLGNKSGISVNTLHLAQYYKIAKDTKAAIDYALLAKRYANEIKNNRDYLTSLQLLSHLDTANSKQYLDTYIAFNDSLIDSERSIQNKFTRIAYETGEYIEANKKLSRDKNNILFIGLAILTIMSLLYYANMQRVQNQKLEMQTARQKANERIYLLTLKQQAKMEEGRIRERNRISEELHDGILGKLFGTRVGLGFLEVSGEQQTMVQRKAFLNELQEIEKEVRTISHDLKNNVVSSEISFINLINKMLKANSQIGNYRYEVNVGDHISWDKIDQLYKVNIYRIIQEALQNTIKYAQATKVIIEFAIVNRFLVVTIADNGVGFNKKKNKKGIGLKNMQSRVTNLNGTFSIQSSKESGTKITLRLPL